MLTIHARIVRFWSNLINDESGKYSSLMYKVVYYLYNSIDVTKHNKFSNSFKWFMCVKNILDKCGLSDIWLNQMEGHVIMSTCVNMLKNC